METLQHSFTYTQIGRKKSLFTRFLKWCEGQEQYRFGWLAVILAVHGCFLSPATVLLLIMGGNSMVLWGFAIGAMAMALISNLSAMPTRITIPVFFLSILIDLGVMVISLRNIFLG